MYAFQRELLNRTIVAADSAKMDGFEHTAAALLAIAKDLYDASSAGTTGGGGSALSLLTKAAGRSSRLLPH
jgi:hypothetical protein